MASGRNGPYVVLALLFNGIPFEIVTKQPVLSQNRSIISSYMQSEYEVEHGLTTIFKFFKIPLKLIENDVRTVPPACHLPSLIF
jgi:hypothetical protein